MESFFGKIIITLWIVHNGIACLFYLQQRFAMVDTEFDPTSNFFTAFRKDFSFVDFHREEAIYWFR